MSGTGEAAGPALHPTTIIVSSGKCGHPPCLCTGWAVLSVRLGGAENTPQHCTATGLAGICRGFALPHPGASINLTTANLLTFQFYLDRLQLKSWLEDKWGETLLKHFVPAGVDMQAGVQMEDWFPTFSPLWAKIRDKNFRSMLAYIQPDNKILCLSVPYFFVYFMEGMGFSLRGRCAENLPAATFPYRALWGNNIQ